VGKLLRNEKEKLQMKRIILFLIITLSSLSVFGMNTGNIRSYVYCIEDYKFLYVYTSNASTAGVSVTQITENAGGRIVPMGCDGTEPKQIKPTPIKH